MFSTNSKVVNLKVSLKSTDAELSGNNLAPVFGKVPTEQPENEKKIRGRKPKKPWNYKCSNHARKRTYLSVPRNCSFEKSLAILLSLIE